jgi:hypothetical protein
VTRSETRLVFQRATQSWSGTSETRTATPETPQLDQRLAHGISRVGRDLKGRMFNNLFERGEAGACSGVVRCEAERVLDRRLDQCRDGW